MKTTKNKKYIYIISVIILIIISIFTSKYLYSKDITKSTNNITEPTIVVPMSAEEITKLDNQEYDSLGLSLYDIHLESDFDNLANSIYDKPKITASYGTSTFKINNKEVVIKNSYKILNDNDSAYGVEYIVNGKRLKFNEYAYQYMGSAEIDSGSEKQFFVILSGAGSMESAAVNILYMNGDKLHLADNMSFPYKGAVSEFDSIFFKNKVFKNKNGQIIFTGNHSPYVSIIFGNTSVKSIEVPVLFTLDKKENKIIKYIPSDSVKKLAIKNFYKKMSDQVSEKLVLIANSKLSEDSLYMATVNILARQYQLNILSGVTKENALIKVSAGAKIVYPITKFSDRYKEIAKKVEDNLYK